MVPLTIRFGTEEFEDRRQLTPAEFWERCRGKGDLPQTAAPSPGAFQAAFQQAADEGADAVLCLTISSKVSGTYGSAVTAADTFSAIPVRVVDTYSLTMGQGLLVIAAAEEAAAGASMDQLVTATEDRIPRTHIYGVLGGLEHLQRGGRIGGARALMGSLLNIKPVIQLKDGEVAEESKQRTRARALAYMNDKVRADAPLERLAVADGACDDFSDVLARLGDIVTEHPLVPVDLGPVVGTHAGPNTVGVLLHRPCQGGRFRRVVSTPWLRTILPTRCQNGPSGRSTRWSPPSTTKPSGRPSSPLAASSSASSLPFWASRSWCCSVSASSA